MDRATIIAATDLSPRSDRAIDRAVRLGAELQCPVKLLHIAKEDDLSAKGVEALARATRATLPDLDAPVEIIVESGAVTKTIAQTAKQLNAGLVAVGAARFNDIGDFFMGTAVDNLLRHSDTPVLVVKHRPHRAYQHILCAVDCSDNSANALRAAITLFPTARIEVIHAYHTPYEGWQTGEGVRDEVRREAEAKLAFFIADAGVPEHMRDRLQSRIGYGDVGKVLGDAVASGDPDLVVLGTHGAGGIKRATLGSTASSLLEWLTPDTLIVPPA